MKLTYVLLFFAAVGSTISNKTYDVFVKSIEDVPYMAVVREIKEFSTSVIITRRFLISGARFLKQHPIEQLFVLTELKNMRNFSDLDKHQVKSVFYPLNNTMGLIELKNEIEFNDVQRPLPLLMRNDFNLNLRLKLEEGMQELKILSYNDDYPRSKNVDTLKFTSLYKRMNMFDLSNQNFTIHTGVPFHTFYNSGPCLIVNGKLAGIAQFINETEIFQGNFAGIPHHFKWISEVVGFENLKESFFHIHPEK